MPGGGPGGKGCGVKILGGGPGEAACAPGCRPCGGAVELNPAIGGACIGSGLLFVCGVWLPPAIGDQPKARGSVTGWVGGVAAGAPCLWGLFLLKALAPLEEGGGPTAPGGVVRGGGCILGDSHKPSKLIHLLEISL